MAEYNHTKTEEKVLASSHPATSNVHACTIRNISDKACQLQARIEHIAADLVGCAIEEHVPFPEPPMDFLGYLNYQMDMIDSALASSEKTLDAITNTIFA